MRLRTPLGHVRGLGSAKDGVALWWAQRITAVALLPLLLWLTGSLAASAGMDHAAAKEWLSNPLSAILMILLIGSGFHHAQLGFQVVIEDYVHRHNTRTALLIANTLFCWLFGLIGVFAVAKIAL